MSGRREIGTPRTVTARTMAILGAFSSARPAMGLQDISRRTGLAVSPLLTGSSPNSRIGAR